MRLTISKNTSFYPHVLAQLERLAKRMKVPLSYLLAYRTLHPHMALEGALQEEAEDIRDWIEQERVKAKKKAR
jgi:hypothetical protein